MNNELMISGRLAEEITFSHEAFGRKYYTTCIYSTRTSGTVDVIPVMLSEEHMTMVKIGDFVQIEGSFRSYNKIVDGRNKLLLHIFVKSISVTDDLTEYNELGLKGFICKEPKFRTTPKKRMICDVLLAVNRDHNNHSDYIPCIAWGKYAEYMTKLSVSSKIEVVGRIQSREYVKKNDETEEVRVAYEVSIVSIPDADCNDMFVGVEELFEEL